MSTQYVAHFIGEQFDHHQVIVQARNCGRARSKAKKKFFKKFFLLNVTAFTPGSSLMSRLFLRLPSGSST